MKVKKIAFRNFRGFKELELELGDRLTVLIGVNGSGKSSVLEALAISLSWLLRRVRSKSGSGRQLQELDIHVDESEASNTVEVDFEGQRHTWRNAKTREGHKQHSSSEFSGIRSIVSTLQTRFEEQAEANIPLALLYGVNRAVLDIPLRIRKKHEFKQFSAYDDALTGLGSDFRLFFEWFREREDLENERRLYPAEQEGSPQELATDLDYRDPQLQAVRQAIADLTGFTNLHISRKPLRMEAKKGEQSFDVRQLSDGEKCHLALAGDLARRLAIANPGLESPLEGEAIVLIDEVELHLHPGWQHQVIPQLLSTFPNCQFILTTHSPQVVSHVHCQDLWCLRETSDGIEAIRPEGTYGQDSNFILQTLMGSSSRPPLIEEQIERLFQLIASDYGQARELLEKLREQVEGNSPKLIRAETLIHRQGLMKK